MVANAKARAREHLINAKLLQLTVGPLRPVDRVHFEPIFTPATLPLPPACRVDQNRGAGGQQLHDSK